MDEATVPAALTGGGARFIRRAGAPVRSADVVDDHKLYMGMPTTKPVHSTPEVTRTNVVVLTAC